MITRLPPVKREHWAFPVKVGMPVQVMELMKLYPQPIQQSGIEYLPIDIPRRRRV